MSRPMRAALAAVALSCARPPSPAPPAPVTDGDWPAYGHTALGDRFSPLAEITRENVSRLQDGRQYVVVAAGGDGKFFGKADEVIAFALPRSRAATAPRARTAGAGAGRRRSDRAG